MQQTTSSSRSDGYPTSETEEYCGLCRDCERPGEKVITADATIQSNTDLPEFGELECVVLLVHFEDTAPRGSPAEFEEFLFGENPDIGIERESVSDYWEQVSYGQMTLSSGPEGIGGWYEIPVTESEYENANQPYDLIYEEAVKVAKNDGFDFDAYDDPFLLVYRAGGDGPAWGGPGGDYAGVAFEGSIDCWTQPEISDQSISVSCHELGHALGLPHAYNDGLGDLALMSNSGTFNSPPSGLCAHEKNNIGPDGWINWDGRSDWTGTTDVWLESGENFGQPLIVPPATDVDENYRIWDGTRNDDSRYTMEYRPGQAIDRDLASPGFAVYYFPETSGFEHPLGGTTISPDGSTFKTASADIRHPNAEVEFELDTVETDYGCVLCNDPPKKSVSDATASVYAIPIDLDDLPDGTAINASGDTQIDARVAWQADANDIALELIAPDGNTNAQSDGTDANFAIVRSDPISSSSGEGGWKLIESVSGERGVEYAQAVNHPTYELATTTTVFEAVDLGETLEATVELAYGDGSTYEPDGFGPVTADQFAIDIAGHSVAAENVTVTNEGSGTYTLTVDGINADPGDEVSVTFIDQKAGATHTTSPDATTVGSITAQPANPMVLKEVSLSTGRFPDDAEYEWSMGDGTTRTGSSVTHRYADRGTYEIELTVTMADGETQAATKTLDITPLEPFSIEPSDPGPFEEVSFDGEVALNGASYEWAMGDGTTRTGPQVTHVYETGGKHIVELTVTASDGADSSVARTVDVGRVYAPIDPGTVSDGVEYYYRNVWNDEEQRGVTDNIDLDGFSVWRTKIDYDGYVQIPDPGIYELTLDADQWAILYIDGERITRAETGTSSEQLPLQSGLHEIRVEYHEQYRDNWLEVRMAGNGMSGKVPASQLYHSEDEPGPSLRASGESLSPGGFAEISIDQATDVEAITIEDLWTDWTVTDVTAPDATVDNQVDGAGTCRLTYDGGRSLATPTITVSLPERYVGGEYQLTVTAIGNGDTVSTEISLIVS